MECCERSSQPGNSLVFREERWPESDGAVDYLVLEKLAVFFPGIGITIHGISPNVPHHPSTRLQCLRPSGRLHSKNHATPQCCPCPSRFSHRWHCIYRDSRRAILPIASALLRGSSRPRTTSRFQPGLWPTDRDTSSIGMADARSSCQIRRPYPSYWA